MSENVLYIPEADHTRQDSIDAFKGSWLGHQYTNQVARMKHLPPAEEVILGLHRRILGPTLPEGTRDKLAGAYRTVRIFVTGSKTSRPNYIHIPSLMEDFGRRLDDQISALDSRKVVTLDFERIMHLIAFSSYWVARIHPFRDGNGRVSRGIANLVTKRFGLHHLMFNSGYDDSERKKYIESLEQTHQKVELDVYDRNIDWKNDLAPYKIYVTKLLLDSYEGLSGTKEMLIAQNLRHIIKARHKQ